MDNTLGPNSPHAGRIYAAFVGYINFAIITSLPNPTTNTDIFLTHSDDGGLVLPPRCFACFVSLRFACCFTSVDMRSSELAGVQILTRPV